MAVGCWTEAPACVCCSDLHHGMVVFSGDCRAGFALMSGHVGAGSAPQGRLAGQLAGFVVVLTGPACWLGLQHLEMGFDRAHETWPETGLLGELAVMQADTHPWPLPEKGSVPEWHSADPRCGHGDVKGSQGFAVPGALRLEQGSAGTTH